jgi:hypothetical protein
MDSDTLKYTNTVSAGSSINQNDFQIDRKALTLPNKNIFSTYEKNSAMEKAYAIDEVSTLNGGKTFEMTNEKTFDLVNNLSNNNEIPISNLNPTLPEDFFVSPTERSH